MIEKWLSPLLWQVKNIVLQYSWLVKNVLSLKEHAIVLRWYRTKVSNFCSIASKAFKPADGWLLVRDASFWCASSISVSELTGRFCPFDVSVFVAVRYAVDHSLNQGRMRLRGDFSVTCREVVLLLLFLVDHRVRADNQHTMRFINTQRSWRNSVFRCVHAWLMFWQVGWCLGSHRWFRPCRPQVILNPSVLSGWHRSNFGWCKIVYP